MPKQVAILDSLLKKGHEGIVPLLDYGVMDGRCSAADSARQQQQQQPQWVLVFPLYAGSLKAWRHKRGKGLQRQDIALYLRVFLRVGIIQDRSTGRSCWMLCAWLCESLLVGLQHPASSSSSLAGISAVLTGASAHGCFCRSAQMPQQQVNPLAHGRDQLLMC
jgi:hypothetical protein